MANSIPTLGNTSVPQTAELVWNRKEAHRFRILVTKDEDGVFSAIVLNLPGTGSCGSTEEERWTMSRRPYAGLLKHTRQPTRRFLGKIRLPRKYRLANKNGLHWMTKVPRISGTDAIRAFKKSDFYEDRTKGSHHILKKAGHPYVNQRLPGTDLLFVSAIMLGEIAFGHCRRHPLLFAGRCT